MWVFFLYEQAYSHCGHVPNLYNPKKEKDMRKSVPASPGLHESFASARIPWSTARPTVSLVLVCENRLCLVRPKKAEQDWWILPQGPIRSTDRTILNAAIRLLNEEIGLAEVGVRTTRMAMLGEFESSIPAGRQAFGIKYHYVVGVPVSSKRGAQPDSSIASMIWEEPQKLDARIAKVQAQRPAKAQGILSACSAARARGFFKEPTIH
jgi:ADP-ribose pyrophosphatase YjhB (NUDIX family)